MKTQALVCRVHGLMLCLLLFSFLESCKKQEPIENTLTPKILQYIFISHTRLDQNPGIDSLVESINFAAYDLTMLGGDLAWGTSNDTETINHADSIFHLGNSNTLWALGNHDYDNIPLIRTHTRRDTFYTYYRNGITFIVLDTQDSLSNITGLQRELFNHVLDTITTSSHLILLMHKLIWMYGNPDLESQINNISNGEFGTCFYCLNSNNFNSEFYPKLVNIRNKGIQVLCLGGDIGFKVNQFSYTSPEGIVFLASGINYQSPEKLAILFNHDLKSATLSWNYISLMDL